MPQVIRRKPLQPSTRALELEKGPRLPGTDMHPTLRRTWYDENGKLVSNETAHGSVPLVNYSVSQQYLPPPDSSRIYGHQLFPVLPYAESEKEDFETWRESGNTVVCIGQDIVLRLESTAIHSSGYDHLIAKLQDIGGGRVTGPELHAPVRKSTPVHFLLMLAGPADSTSQSRYRNSVRNFFAALRGRPIVGRTLVSELSHLHLIAIDLLGSQDQPEMADNFVRNYVQRLHLDDCRHLRSETLELLDWCEQTRWEKGWIESFAHCVGMLGIGIDQCDGFAALSLQTQGLLRRSQRQQQHAIYEVQSILSGFHIAGDPPSSDSTYTVGLQAARAFEQFLLDYYTHRFEKWPPATDVDMGEIWLTRTLAQRLQDDFGSLYDLLVDSDDVRNPQHQGAAARTLHADDTNNMKGEREAACASNFPLQKLMLDWNTEHGYKPIPHSWSLLPKLLDLKPQTKDDSLVPALREVDTGRSGEHARLRNAYMSGTNRNVQLTDFSRAFLKHEAKFHLAGANTHDARLGRWLVVHHMMQSLSRVAVDIRGLWYRHGVPYFLNAALENCPPWENATIPGSMRPASIEDSWCWIYAKGLAESRRQKSTGGEKPARKPKPKYRVKWDEEGQWQLKSL